MGPIGRAVYTALDDVARTKHVQPAEGLDLRGRGDLRMRSRVFRLGDSTPEATDAWAVSHWLPRSHRARCICSVRDDLEPGPPALTGSP